MNKLKTFLATLIIVGIAFGVLIFEQIGWLYLSLIFIFPFFGVDKLFISDFHLLNKIKSLDEVDQLVDSSELEEVGDFDGGVEGVVKQYIKGNLEEYIELAKIENSSEMMNKKFEHTSIINKPLK